jgi:outer membrane immunogenic protein
MTTASYAADLVVSPPPVAPAPVITENPFNGFYLGIHGGYGWASNGGSGDGWLVGGQGGYNWVGSSGLLIGAELSGSWADVGDSFVTMNGLGILQAKLGWANEQIALYATGGGALASLDTNVPVIGGFDDTPGGWTVGAGMDFMLGRDWSLGASYNYVDFGTNNAGASSVNVLKLNLNYNF